MAFELRDVAIENIPEMVAMMSDALKNDEMWQTLKGTATDEAERNFLECWIQPRFGSKKDEFEGWKIVEAATGVMVAWAMLTKPHSRQVSEKDSAATHGFGPAKPPEGWNLPAAAEFERRVITSTARHGYDPEQDYHRSTTIVHPKYQRRGFGRWLSRRCDEIADRTGKFTYVRARPGATALFLTLGYELIEDVEIDFRPFGGNANIHSYCLRRDPRPIGEPVETFRM